MGFYAVTGSVLGSYEGVAATTRRMPTVTTWGARNFMRRIVLVLWALGLAVHFARAKP